MYPTTDEWDLFFYKASDLDQLLEDAEYSGNIVPESGVSLHLDNAVVDYTAIQLSSNIQYTSTIKATVSLGSLPADFSSINTDRVGLALDTDQQAGVWVLFSGIGIGVVVDGVVHRVEDSEQLIADHTVSKTVRMVIDGRANKVLVYFNDAGQSEQLIYAGELGYDAQPVDAVRWEVLGSGYRIDLQEWYGSRDSDVNSLPDAVITSPTKVGVGKYLLLDGRESSSPDGNELIYRWSVVSVPISSKYAEVYYGETGASSNNPDWEERITVPDGINTDLIRASDVVICGTRVSKVSSASFDEDGNLIDSTLLLCDSAIFPKNSAKIQFEIQFNSVIADPTSELTYAAPDVAGVWQFRLDVTDSVTGISAHEIVVIDVEPSMFLSSMPLDMSMLWNLVGNQWDLVKDKDKIQAVWDAMSLVMSGLLLYLWEVNASKSLATIPRRFIRKWWRVPTFLDAIFFGEVVEKYDEVILPIISDGISDPLVSEGGDLEIVIEGVSVIATIPANPTLDQVVTSINSHWAGLARTESKRIILDTGGHHAVVKDSVVAADLGLAGKATFLEAVVDVEADAQTIVVGSNFPISWVAESLKNSWVSVGDQDGIYGHLRLVSRVDVDNQRITLSEPLPKGSLVSVPFVFGPRLQQSSIDFDTLHVCSRDSLSYLRGAEQEEEVWDIAGSSESWLMIKPTPLALYGFGEERVLAGLYKRDIIPVFDETVSIPSLRDEVETATTVYYEGQHYVVEHQLESSDSWMKCLGDRLDPVKGWWAEFVYLTADPTIYDNFGVLVDFSPEDASEQDYLQAVSGLFYLIFRAPALQWVRLGVHIVASLPFAEEEGVVLDVLSWWSTDYGRILIAGDSGRIYSYAYPTVEGLAINPMTGRRYAVGDRVEKWAPLSAGVEVVDQPGWGGPYGLTWLEQVHRYLVRLDVDIFPPELVSKMKSFLHRVSPVWSEQVVRPVKSLVDDLDLRSELKWTPSILLLDTVGSSYDDHLDGVVGESNLQSQMLKIDSGEWLDNTQVQTEGYIGRYILLSLPESIGGIALSRLWFFWDGVGEPVDEDVTLYVPGWYASGSDVGEFIQNYSGYSRQLQAIGSDVAQESGGKFGDGTFYFADGSTITIDSGAGAYQSVSVIDTWYRRSTSISGLNQEIFTVKDSGGTVLASFYVEDNSGTPTATLTLSAVGSATFVWSGATDDSYHHIRMTFDPLAGKVAVLIDGIFQKQLIAASALNGSETWVVGGEGDCWMEAITLRVSVDYDQYTGSYKVPGHKWPVVFTENYNDYDLVVSGINGIYNRDVANLGAEVITDPNGNRRLKISPKVRGVSYGGDMAESIGFGSATDWVPLPITVDQDAYNIASEVEMTITETYSGDPPKSDSVFFADSDGLYADAASLTGDQSVSKVVTN